MKLKPIIASSRSDPPAYQGAGSITLRYYFSLGTTGETSLL
ncbi:MAG: hypothetical protein QXQ90_08695 [Desulfurococcaceae archaeon]